MQQVEIQNNHYVIFVTRVHRLNIKYCFNIIIWLNRSIENKGCLWPSKNKEWGSIFIFLAVFSLSVLKKKDKAVVIARLLSLSSASCKNINEVCNSKTKKY